MAKINYTATDKALNKFGNEVVRKARFNLTNQKRYVSGKLWKSIDYKSITSNRSISLKFVMEEYGIVLDEGRGKSQGGGSGELYPKILEWVKKKGLRPRDSKGKFTAWKNKAKQQEGIAFAVTRKIHRFGYKPTNFFSDAFKLSFKKLPRTIKKTFALDVERFMQQTIDEINKL